MRRDCITTIQRYVLYHNQIFAHVHLLGVDCIYDACVPVYVMPGDAWQVVAGSSYCQIVDKGRCITDGYGRYGSHESCRVKALTDLTITAKQFKLESCCDKIRVGGISYNGKTMKVKSGSDFYWSSDGSKVDEGFKVCAQVDAPPPGIMRC